MNKGEEASTSAIDGLFAAAKAGYEDDIKELLGMKVNVNAQDNQGNTALHYAAGASHTAVVSLLLTDASINANIANKLGDTPLHRAAARGGEEVVKLLLAKGASPSTNLSNVQGKRPKDVAKDSSLAALLEPVSVSEYPFDSEDEVESDESD